jgi:small nuclear ribonucleoprotein (snRNP)-like protein
LEKRKRRNNVSNRPFDDLNKAMGETILVHLKGERTVRGTLKAFDVHLNLVLENAEELKGNETKIKYAKIMVRGDNVIFIAL